MKLHKNWEVTENGLKKLREMSETELKKLIADKKLFAGLPTDYAKKENAKIYGKINTLGTKKKAGTVDAPKAKGGNRKDNKK